MSKQRSGLRKSLTCGLDETGLGYAIEDMPAQALEFGMKKSVKKEILGYLKIIAAGVIIAVLLNRFVIINADITSGSMSTTLEKGDKLIGLRFAYIFSEPKRGDIIIFEYPDDGEKLLIKRVIGLPGDMVIIKDGLVYINGSEEPLDEPYAHGTNKQDFGPYMIPADCYFVLGDNRDNSKDSRYWTNTYVTKKQIIAKALFRYNNGFKTFK